MTDLRQNANQAVTWGYRLFLDREPESIAVVEDKANRVTTSEEIRKEFINCHEYKAKLLGVDRVCKMYIDNNKSRLPELLSVVEDSWEKMGRTEPYYSVLTSDVYKMMNLDVVGFYSTGKHDVENIFSILDNYNIDAGRLKSCLEFGCGVGRMTKWLARKFDIVHGFDISRSHLEIAKECVAGDGNVELHHVDSISSLDNLPKVDFVYSLIVLQHNPPPIIAHIISRLLRCLNVGGVAMIQLPTYLPNYVFDVKEYLKIKSHNIEMHALPQQDVFRIISQERCLPVAIWEDGAMGIGIGISNSFLITHAQ